MYDENVKSNQAEGKPTQPEMTDCCGPAMAEMMKDCPCGSALKKHRGVASVMIMGVVLALLISQVGGVLGIIAFFRLL